MVKSFLPVAGRRWPVLFCLGCWLGLAATAAAQQGVRLVAQAPPPGPPRPFHFPPVATRTLPNGMRVFVVADHRQPAVSVALLVTSAGTAQDPPTQAGLAQLTASLLTQGTEKRSAREIAEAIDFVGGSLSAFAGRDETTVVLTVTKKDFSLGMDLLADVTRHPSFPEEELERIRQQTLSALRVDYADAGYLATAVLNRLLFGPRGYGLPQEGTPTTLTAIRREDVVGFHQRFYCPQRALLAFAGDLTPEEGFAAAEKFFGDWKAAVPPPVTAAPPLRPQGLEIVVVDKPDAVQTQIRVGRPAIARNDPNYIPLLVTNRIFGGGYNSLLNTAVRVQKGLTYGANSGLTALRFGGMLLAATSTRTEQTVAAAQLIVSLLRRVAAGQLSQNDLDLARDYLTGVYPIQIETPSQVAQRVLTVAEYGLPEDYNQTYPQRIAAVTLAQVREMAKEYFDPSQLLLVLVGNAAQFRDELKKAFPNASYQEIPVAQLDLLSADLRRHTASAPAASPSAATSARQLFEQAAQAAGGAALAAVKTAEFVEQTTVNSPQGAATIERRVAVDLSGRVSVELTLPTGAALRMVTDGQTGWMSSGGMVSALPPPLLEQLRLQVQIARGLGFYRQVLTGTAEAETLGSEQLQGKTVVAVEWKAPTGSLRLYFDPASHLLVGLRRNDPQLGEVTEVWSDFRAVDGVQLPFRVVAYQGASKLAETIVKQARLNPPLDPALFAKPQP